MAKFNKKPKRKPQAKAPSKPARHSGRNPTQGSGKDFAKDFAKDAGRSGPRPSARGGTVVAFGERSPDDNRYRLTPAEQEAARRGTSEKLNAWRAAGAALKSAPKPSKAPGSIALDPWQEDAVEALLSGSHVVVDAPTTAGKTRVVEAFFDQHIGDAGFRACYTCPVKSLATDKLREFRERYGKDRVGIATGDVKENLDAPLVVATLESYRNSLLGVEPDLGRRLVVYDEYHYLQDEGRGSAWEESIILTPPQCQMLMLSASLANAGDFADWLAKLTGRPAKLVTTTTRPVPLVDMVWFDNSWYVADTLPASWVAKRRASKRLEPLTHQELAERLLSLPALGLTPSIVYCGKRLACEHLAKAIATRLPPLEIAERQAIGQAIQKADAELQVLSFLSPPLRQLIQTYGVAYHHSGLTPPVRVTIESLVKEGLLRFCTATMGLSLGINFSVKSTVISDAMRPGENGLTPYSSSEVLQMTGRAGRRGLDAVGYSCWPNLDYYHRYSKAERERCASRLRNDPTTFLGLVSRGFGLGQIEQFYRKSFLRFNDPKVDVTVLAPYRVSKQLGHDTLPCPSPAHEYAAYRAEQNARCYDCPLLNPCHTLLGSIKPSKLSLAGLHLHLHAISALDGKEGLSDYGELARFFPQAGGLLLANMIIRNEITAANLSDGAQLMAALSLARFKVPSAPLFAYRFPFRDQEIERDLKVFYPLALFPEQYESDKSRRTKAQVFKEFNPQAGHVVKMWADGMAWPDLLRQVSNEQFGAGDLMALIYRTASYLQSLIQARHGELSECARDLRAYLLREPFQMNF